MFRECAYIWVGVGGESLGRSVPLLGFVRTSQPCLLPHDPYSDLWVAVPPPGFCLTGVERCISPVWLHHEWGQFPIPPILSGWAAPEGRVSRSALNKEGNSTGQSSEEGKFIFMCLLSSWFVVHVSCFSRVWLLVTSMDWSPPGSSVHGFPRQKCWSGLPFPSPGDPDPGIEPVSLTSPMLAGRFSTITSTTWKPFKCILMLDFFRCSLGKPKTSPSFLDLTTTGKSCTFCQTGLWPWVPACSCWLFLLRFCWLSGCEHSLWLPCALANITVTRTISWSPELSATLKSFCEGGQVHARETFLCCS